MSHVAPNEARIGRRAPRLALALPCAALLAACAAAGAARDAAGSVLVEATRPLMGTTFRVVVDAAAGDEAAARAALEAALAAAAEVEGWASDWDAGSEVRRVCAAADGLPPGTPLPLSPALAEHLAFALELAARTDGAFDPTLGTLTRLWRRSARLGALPSAARLAEARARAGHGRARVDRARGTLSVAAPGLRLDLGGSAKGAALDAALAALAARGFPRALVDGGGDVLVGEPPRGARGWRVAIEPLGPGGGVLRVTAARCALATSGDAARAFELDGVRYGHVLDPATGLGITVARAATVAAPDGRTADALATALVVRGAPGLALAAAFPGCEAAVFEGGACAFPACATEGFPNDGGHLEGAPRAPAPHR